MLLITHNLEHLWAIADRIVVLRGVRRSPTCARMTQVREDVVAYITGAKGGDLASAEWLTTLVTDD